MSRKRYNEAGRVLLDYCKNVDEAIAAFGQGGDFPEAERVVSGDRDKCIFSELMLSIFVVRVRIPDGPHRNDSASCGI